MHGSKARVCNRVAVFGLRQTGSEEKRDPARKNFDHVAPHVFLLRAGQCSQRIAEKLLLLRARVVLLAVDVRALAILAPTNAPLLRRTHVTICRGVRDLAIRASLTRFEP